MPEDDRLSDIDRRSLRILARSSKTSVASGRLSERLERAAESGSRTDYEKAEQTFDSLPPEDRLRISAKAEKQATTERDLVVKRKRSATRSAPPPVSAGDDALDWKPIFSTSPGKASPPPPQKAKPAAGRKTDVEDDAAGMTWKLGAIPGNPKMPTTGRTAKAPTPTPGPQVADDWEPEDDQKDWDWRKIPDDPVLNGGRKKDGKVDPIEELRNQMLGLDAKYGKR
ncbi:MAG: hypothetical protein P1U88_12990 [Thalassobaculaceae bacterium]|nr:hypothetical protein [Thalassobaculaceae bacterium]